MNIVHRIQYLQVALVVAGVACLALYPLMLVWPSGWAWHTGYSDYPAMLVGIYCTLGVFLMLAAKDPLSHLSLIWFAVWSSIVHGAIMMVQALANPHHRGHLVGDVPVLFVLAAVLGALTPRGPEAHR